MKKFILYIVILCTITSSFYAKSKKNVLNVRAFTFINKTLDTITIQWTPSFMQWNLKVPIDLLGWPAGIVLQPGEKKSVKTECISRIRIGLGVLKANLFDGLFAPEGKYYGEWIDGYIWKGFVPKCGGVGQIIKKKNRFKIRWLK